MTISGPDGAAGPGRLHARPRRPDGNRVRHGHAAQAQLFCEANILEIRTDGPRWHIGMVLNCADYARRGRTLLEGQIGYFDSAAEVLVPGRADSRPARSRGGTGRLPEPSVLTTT